MQKEQTSLLFGEIDPSLTYDVIVKQPTVRNENTVFAFFQKNHTLSQQLSFPADYFIPQNHHRQASSGSEYALIKALKAENKKQAAQILSSLSTLENLRDGA